MNIFNGVENETAGKRGIKKQSCARCDRSLRRVDHGIREFWRCEGWFDAGDPCFAAFDEVSLSEGQDVEKLDWPIADDENLH